MISNTCSFRQFDITGGKLKLASHVLQFVYLSHGGFRFPIAHFATSECQAAELHLLFWEAVDNLLDHGFEVINLVSMSDIECVWIP